MVVALAARRHGEMSRENGEESSASRRKRARATRDSYDVKKEVFAVGKMSGQKRKVLQERFQSELVAVRRLLAKAEFLVPQAVKGGAAPPSSSPAAPRGKDGRFLVAEPRSEEPMEANKSKVAKRRKTMPLVEHMEAPKMTLGKKEELAARLASLSASLSAHVVELLQKQSQGCTDEIEIDIYSMDDAVLFELNKQLDKFAKQRNRVHSAIDAASPQQREDGEIVEEVEEQKDEHVDTCGAVSPLAIAPSPLQLEVLQYGDIFQDTELQLLSPLPHKYVALAEEEEYLDICGGVSPVVIQNLGEIRGSPISSPSSDSNRDGGVSDSDSDSGDSDSDSDDDSGGKVSSPAPAVVSKVNDDSSRPSEPLSEQVQSAEPEKLPEQHAPAPPAKPMTELIAKAQGALETRRQEEKSLEREKCRQELLEMERTAMASDSIHPIDLKLLGIADYVVSTAQQGRPGRRPSLLQQLGLFLKADDDGGDEQEQQPRFDPGDLEEGEIP